MAWSTRQLAELTGTSVKTVRHYHAVGLLDEPPRAANGYKQYTTVHLVRMLTIRRLVELGMPLARIRTIDLSSEGGDDVLRTIDAELAATIDRLQRLRAGIAESLTHESAATTPSGFAAVVDGLSSPDRDLVTVFSGLLDATAMAEIRSLADVRHPTLDVDFDELPPDADDAQVDELVGRLLPVVRQLRSTFPTARAALTAPGSTTDAVQQAITDLYNPAQVRVLRRVGAALRSDGDA